MKPQPQFNRLVRLFIHSSYLPLLILCYWIGYFRKRMLQWDFVFCPRCFGTMQRPAHFVKELKLSERQKQTLVSACWCPDCCDSRVQRKTGEVETTYRDDCYTQMMRVRENFKSGRIGGVESPMFIPVLEDGWFYED